MNILSSQSAAMRKSTKWMILFWLVTCGFGIFEVTSDSLANHEAYLLTSTLVTVLLTVIWFLEDARHIHHTPSFWLKLAVVAVPFVAIPYYLIRYKGWRRAIQSFALFLGWAGVCLLVCYVAAKLLNPALFGS